MPTVDADRIETTSAGLLTALQTSTDQRGIGVFSDCSMELTRSWVRNAPSTNYYLWPSMLTYSAAHVSGLLDGAAMFKSRTAGNTLNRFAVVRVSPTVFEVWH
jgi:hypothetical protein